VPVLPVYISFLIKLYTGFYIIIPDRIIAPGPCVLFLFSDELAFEIRAPGQKKDTKKR
jgi:hypothetical protein